MTKPQVLNSKALNTMPIPLFSSSVAAGFPSPADDYVERKLDLNEYLIKSQASTFFVRVRGHSMNKAGIFDGDLLIVDRSLEVKNRNVVVAMLDGEFTVKRFIKRNQKFYLVAENDDFKPIEVTAEMEFLVWGVVTNVIHSLL
ncbi:MAG: translesion error-prone DNA polymerase V autoproteolytic subunit [bacterium]|nr:translesion error-prone DNA polymerase V autoproteolytic subunit [bacterium]